MIFEKMLPQSWATCYALGCFLGSIIYIYPLYSSVIANKPVSNFGHLKHFQCTNFNQSVSSFGHLTHFDCNNFANFDSLNYLKQLPCFGA